VALRRQLYAPPLIGKASTTSVYTKRKKYKTIPTMSRTIGARTPAYIAAIPDTYRQELRISFPQIAVA
jgi:hypothetical protein